MKTNKTKHPAEWYEIADRVMNTLGTFTRREFLRFVINCYPYVPFKEFGAFFDDEWITKMVNEEKRIVATPPLVFDEVVFTKSNLVPTPKAEEIEVLTADKNLIKQNKSYE